MNWRRALLISAIVSIVLTVLLGTLTGSKAFGLFLVAPLILAAGRLKRDNRRELEKPVPPDNRPIHPE